MPDGDALNGGVVPDSETLVKLQVALEESTKTLEEVRKQSADDVNALLLRVEAAESAVIAARTTLKTEDTVDADVDALLKDTDAAIVDYHKKIVGPAEKKMLRELQTARATLQAEVDYVRKEIRMEAEIRRAEKAHPDFDQHTDAMIEISKKNPSLNIETLYKMAKLDTTEKKSAADTKQAELAAKIKRASSERPGSTGAGMGTKTVGITNAVDNAFDEHFNADGTPKS